MLSWQPNFDLLYKSGHKSSRMHCIFNNFACAGGLGIGDFR